MKTRLVAVLVSVLLTVSCNRSGPSPLISENELLARMLMADFQSGDVSNLSGMFYPTAVYDDYSSQNQYQGLKEISGYVTSLSSWADNLSVDVNAVHASETGATVEWTLNADQVKPIPGRVSVGTGADIQVNGVTILEISHHLITRAADYMDDLGMMLQLGGVMTMPGGTVIRGEAAPRADTSGTGR
jgi:SnoaL-like domain